jgi:hypothetical protein
VELRTVEVSLNPQARKFQKDLAIIRSHHLRDFNLNHIKVQEIIKETHLEIEATTCEFQAGLEVAEARAELGKGTRNLRKCGAATKILRVYILGYVPTSVGDRSGTPQLVATGEIDLLDHNSQRPGRRRTVQHSKKRDL